MIAYLIRRLGYAAIMLVLVSFTSFLIIDLPPGDYMDQKLAELAERGDRSAETRIEDYRAKYGLDKPLLTRYWLWASNFVKGDFGESFQYERPVRDILGERLQMTLVVALFATAVMWIVAIPAGVYSAVNQYSLGDQIMTAVAFLGMGMPNFLLALLILFFAVVVLDADITGLFSREFRDAPWSLAKMWDLFKHLWIPGLISAITGASMPLMPSIGLLGAHPRHHQPQYVAGSNLEPADHRPGLYPGAPGTGQLHGWHVPDLPGHTDAGRKPAGRHRPGLARPAHPARVGCERR